MTLPKLIREYNNTGIIGRRVQEKTQVKCCDQVKGEAKTERSEKEDQPTTGRPNKES